MLLMVNILKNKHDSGYNKSIEMKDLFKENNILGVNSSLLVFYKK